MKLPSLFPLIPRRGTVVVASAQPGDLLFDAYSPLIEKWARLESTDRPESRLDYHLWRMARAGQTPVHMNFLPWKSLYLSRHAPNVSLAAPDYPHVPGENLGSDPRANAQRLANRLDLILAASQFARAALQRSLIDTPIHVVPPPIHDCWFDLETSAPENDLELNVIPLIPAAPEVPRDPWSAHASPLAQLPWHERNYHLYAKRLMPNWLQSATRRCARLAHRFRPAKRNPVLSEPITLLAPAVTYLAHVDPLDPRQAWRDLLSAFVLALGDRDDAGLILRVTTPGGAEHLWEGHRLLGLQHRALVGIVAGPWCLERDIDLLRASTYGVNVLRAAGVALDIPRCLAAGRPVLCPRHTGFADYIHDGLAFVVRSSREPTAWPDDPSQRLATTWHRLDWQSLFEQFRESFRVALEDRPRYQRMADRARIDARAYAHSDVIGPLLTDALNTLPRKRKPGRTPSYLEKSA